jgi:hypothetical protein
MSDITKQTEATFARDAEFFRVKHGLSQVRVVGFDELLSKP